MSFLDNNGLAYFYGKLKEKFIRSVTAGGTILIPDSSGNVTVSNVATADNLTAPDAQASYDIFNYRTSGGNASLASGEAQLVYIDGNMDISGRIPESFTYTTTNDIELTYSLSTWKSQIDTSGTYEFSFTRGSSSTAAVSWSSSGSWSYDGSTTSLSSYGIYPTNLVNASISASVSGSGISAATVVPSTFFGELSDSGTYVFTYSGEETSWQYNGTNISLATYGLAVTGTAQNEDTITITSVRGTPNSTIIITYVAPEQGTISIPKPTKFSATGFNQFDKSTMTISGLSINDNYKIVSNSNRKLCYCRAKGGVDGGYVCYESNGKIKNIAWSATIPALDDQLSASNWTSRTYNNTLSKLEFPNDGYLVVSIDISNGGTVDNVCMHPSFSGAEDTTFKAYVAPSQISLPTKDTSNTTIPLGDYGMPKIGSVADRLNLDAGTYIKKIGRLANTSANMSTVVGYGTDYEYDDNYIYYVLPTEVTYTVSVNSTYTVNDYGTEEFISTTIPMGAQTLYGQNLRDKLRTDVVTISQQTLTNNQKKQVLANIGAVPLSGTVSGSPITNTIYSQASFWSSFPTLSRAQDPVPSSLSYRYFGAQDIDNKTVGACAFRIGPRDGFSNTCTSTYLYNVNGKTNGSIIYNGLVMGVESGTGTPFVSMDYPAAWRSALGLSSLATATKVNIADGGTGETTALDACISLLSKPWIGFDLAGGSTHTISISGSAQGLLILTCNTAGKNGIYLFSASTLTTSSRTLALVPVTELTTSGNTVTATPSTGSDVAHTITITSSGGASSWYMYAHILCFNKNTYNNITVN